VLRERGRGERPLPSEGAAAQDWTPFSSSAAWLAPARSVLRSPEPVLIIGEAGAGKSALAHAVCRNRGSGALVSVDCANVGLRALETAWKQAVAAGATGVLLLERLLDLPPNLQARLVAWLDAASVPAGRPWIVATASVAAEAALRSSGLRPDLLERLSANLLRVPPLRERADEIARIVGEVLVELEPSVYRLPEPIAEDALRVLGSYSWPGNVRQLQNVLRRAALSSPRAPVDVKALPPEVVAGAAAPPLGRIEQLEVETILTTLRATGNNVTRAAELVGLSRATLYRRLRAYQTRHRTHPL